MHAPDAYSIFSHEDSREETLSSSAPDSWSSPPSLQNSYSKLGSSGIGGPGSLATSGVSGGSLGGSGSMGGFGSFRSFGTSVGIGMGHSQDQLPSLSESAGGYSIGGFSTTGTTYSSPTVGIGLTGIASGNSSLGMNLSGGWKMSVGSPATSSGADFMMDMTALGRQSLQSSQDAQLMQSQNMRNCFWNYKFQKALEAVKKISPTMSYEERERIWHKMSAVSKDFAYCSKSYGRIIISEIGLPVIEKQIKPVDIQGVAGGEKFIVNSILFKFAIDNKGIYEGNESAPRKMAGQDLLWLVAISLIPRTSNSLLYGTADGSRTVFNHPSVTSIMEAVGKELNIASHHVCCRRKGPLNAENIAACADLELHQGADGRYYLIDFARAMPPQDVNVNPCKCNHLIHKLRPEFVQLYPKALNPDAFSKFIQFQLDLLTSKEKELLKTVQEEEKEAMLEIVEATKQLVSKTIPTTAKRLIEITEQLNSHEQLILVRTWLTVVIHFFGINIRWIGALRREMASLNSPCAEIWRMYLLIEALARTCKKNMNQELRNKMKDATAFREQPCRKVTVNYLNLVFGSSTKSQKVWRGQIEPHTASTFVDSEKRQVKEMLIKYTEELDFEQLSREKNSSKKISRNGLCMLFDRLCALMGLQFRPPVKKQLSSSSACFEVSSPFDITDLVSLDEVIKCNHIIAHSQGTILRIRADAARKKEMKDNSKITEYSSSLYAESLLEFRQSLQATPRSAPTLCTTAGVYNNLGFPDLAKLFYKLAIEADPKDANAHFRYGFFLHHVQGKLEEASESYSVSLSLEKDANNMRSYAGLLVKMKKVEEAKNVFEEAIDLFPESVRCHHDYALFLQSQGELLGADKHFLAALKIAGTDIRLIEDYAVFLENDMQDVEKAKLFQSTLNKLTKKKNVTLQESVFWRR